MTHAHRQQSKESHADDREHAPYSLPAVVAAGDATCECRVVWIAVDAFRTLQAEQVGRDGGGRRYAQQQALLHILMKDMQYGDLAKQQYTCCLVFGHRLEEALQHLAVRRDFQRGVCGGAFESDVVDALKGCFVDLFNVERERAAKIEIYYIFVVKYI